MADDLTFREAAPADAGPIAGLHVESWRSAYRGILPDAYLDGDVEPERLRHWERTLEGLALRDVVLLAESGSDLIGFASSYWAKEPGFDAYLDNLHVRPGFRGGGLGRLLFAELVERLIGHGARNLCLWVFDDNDGAVRLYKRLGGTLTERGFDDIGGGKAAHTRIEWHDLPALLAACREGLDP